MISSQGCQKTTLKKQTKVKVFGLSRLLEQPASSPKPRGSFLFMLMFNIHGLPYWTPELDSALQRKRRWAVTPGWQQ